MKTHELIADSVYANSAIIKNLLRKITVSQQQYE